MTFKTIAPILTCAALTLAFGIPAQAQQNAMTFFVTSAGVGKGGDLGGLEGADRQCQTLAQAAGAGSRTWRAYLSTSGAQAVNARDRIGKGPWVNVKGEQIAASVEDLHGAGNKIAKDTALTEKGAIVSGVGDTPNQHDVLTGSQADGTAFPASQPDRTCGNWTSSADAAGSAMVGHTDRRNPSGTEAGKSWNSSHPTPGCAQANLVRVGGAGLLYCFAAN